MKVRALRPEALVLAVLCGALMTQGVDAGRAYRRHGEETVPTRLDAPVAIFEADGMNLIQAISRCDDNEPDYLWTCHLWRGWILTDYPSRWEKKAKRVTVRLENVTVRDVLDALTKADGGYYWIQRGNVVNFIPRRPAKGVDVVAKLNEVVPRLSFQNLSVAYLDSELIRQAEAQGITGLYGSRARPGSARETMETVSLSTSNATVLDCLNALVEADPPASWLVYPWRGKTDLRIIRWHTHKPAGPPPPYQPGMDQ